MKKELNVIFASIKIMDFDMFLNTYPLVKIWPKNSDKIFAKKLNAIFEILKSKGDTVLNIKDCTRNCICGKCKSTPYKFIFAFVGNISGDYFGLTVLMNKNFEPFLIEMAGFMGFNIDCQNTDRFDETSKGQKFETQHYFAIQDDELDDFIPNNEYLEEISLMNKALQDLEYNKNTIEDVESLKNWVTTFKPNFYNKRSNYSMFNNFSSLYTNLKGYLEYCDYINEAKLAFNEINSDKRYNPGNMLEWLLKYEMFYHNNFYLLKNAQVEENNDYFIFEIRLKQYRIAKSIFKDLFPFIDYYIENYLEERYLWEKAYLEQNNLTIDELLMKDDMAFVYRLSNFQKNLKAN